MLKECKHCGDTFNTESPEKIMAGGYINECPCCVEEKGGDSSPPKYLGVSAGDGKMSGVTILRFSSDTEREQYKKAWRNNSGQNKGKACQLGVHLSPMTGMSFSVVAENRGNENHKGKL
jgi:hypothetical protein